MRHSFPFLIVRPLCVGAVLIAHAAVGVGALTGADAAQPLAKEREFIATLRSDASAGDKAIACKRLAIVGSPAAVPALAPLLADEELASWARIALEAIPGSEADQVLRDAMDRVEGQLLVGVIHSIGNRKDTQAVGALAAQLDGSDPDVVAAAGLALGRIGGAAAARALESALTRVSAIARSDVAEGCILCAEGFLAAGNAPEAVRMYDLVRAKTAFKPRVVEATRGAILARGRDGLGLLLEQLRSADRDFLNVGLSTARELPGRAVTEALVTEVGRTPIDRQGYLLMAVGDRDDAAVLPAVTELARTGSPGLREVAVGILERRGDLDSLPVLLDAATAEDEGLADSARLALARFGGSDVDAVLVGRLGSAQGNLRRVLIELAGLRGIESAIPRVAASVGDSDPGIRRASVATLGALGKAAQISALVPLLVEGMAARDRNEVEKALVAIAGRAGSASAVDILPLLKSGSTTARVVGLHALAAAGGDAARSAVVSAIEDPVETVQDEAVRTLESWPNTWPEDSGVATPLLRLAKSGRKPSHRVQGLRGYLQYLREDRSLDDAHRMSALETVMPLVQRPEEQRLVVAVLGTVPTSAALELLMGFAEDPETTEEACLAIVNIVGGPRLGSGAADIRGKALEVVLEHSQNGRTRRKARELR